jgi:hypothetical protein
MYSIGIGVVGSYLPSLTIPMFGETGTLWFAIVWVGCGGLVAFFSLRNVPVDRSRVNCAARQNDRAFPRGDHSVY